MHSSTSILAADDKLHESVDNYIPTPNADGSCDPHIKESNVADLFWVVCEDCSTELVEGEANALAALDDCDGASES
jgi:hypothetical protein